MATAQSLGFGQSATNNIYNTSGKFTDITKQPTNKGESRIVINAPLGRSGSSRQNGGLQNVVNVYKNLATLQPITANTGSTAGDLALGLTSQAAGTAALGFGVLGLGAGIISGVTAATAGITATGGSTAGGLTATGALNTPSWLIPAAAGAGAAYLLFGHGAQEQQNTQSQNTNPPFNPYQTTNPEQKTQQSSGLGDSGQSAYNSITGGTGSILNYNLTNRNTSNSSESYQLTSSYQYNTQTTSAGQTAELGQTQSDSWLPVIIAVAAVLFLNNK